MHVSVSVLNVACFYLDQLEYYIMIGKGSRQGVWSIPWERTCWDRTVFRAAWTEGHWFAGEMLPIFPCLLKYICGYRSHQTGDLPRRVLHFSGGGLASLTKHFAKWLSQKWRRLSVTCVGSEKWVRNLELLSEHSSLCREVLVTKLVSSFPGSSGSVSELQQV